MAFLHVPIRRRLKVPAWLQPLVSRDKDQHESFRGPRWPKMHPLSTEYGLFPEHGWGPKK
jgi:hypothetical protein